MSKIISNFFISLDGVVEAPHQWHFPYFNEEMGEAVESGIEDSAGLLMGRKLYQEWASYWPGSNDDPFATFQSGAEICRVEHARIGRLEQHEDHLRRCGRPIGELAGVLNPTYVPSIE